MQPQLSPAFQLRLILVKLFDKVCRINQWRKLNSVLTHTAQNNHELFFVQIGANDGVIYDPIYQFVTRYNLSGILVEPVKHYFEQLKQNYQNNPNLTFENVAISNSNEIRDFYRIRENLDFLPEWCNGLGTFDLDVLLTHQWAIPNIEDYVVTEKVTCITLAELINRNNVKQIDLLLIDTEGFDYQILQQIDFDRIRPGILVYEHQYISKQEKAECEQRLKGYGYQLSHHMGNTLAYS
ncbi:MAG TPA: FkbM family methyltransferase [Crenotrichaceae bacterium]|nr:FkbM family methyltransferase [Crenotrichaceae bacterium]